MREAPPYVGELSYEMVAGKLNFAFVRLGFETRTWKGDTPNCGSRRALVLARVGVES